jgi:hypothetical protein
MALRRGFLSGGAWLFVLRNAEILDRQPENFRWLPHPGLGGVNDPLRNDLRYGISPVGQLKQAQRFFVRGAEALNVLRTKCRTLQHTIDRQGIPHSPGTSRLSLDKAGALFQ